MDAKKFDELIKDQLYDRKSEVNNDSWAKLEFILDSKEDKPAYVWPYWRAIAAVFLLIALGWLGREGVNYWDNTKEWKSSISFLNLEKIDHKTINQSFVTVPNELNKLTLISYTPPICKKTFVSTASTKKHVSIETPPIETIQKDTEGLQTVFEQNDHEEIAYQSLESQSVRITYKRSEPIEKNLDNPQDSTKTNRVIELLNATKGFHPGELLADVRSAKDKMLQNPFGINKQRQRFK